MQYLAIYGHRVMYFCNVMLSSIVLQVYYLTEIQLLVSLVL